MNTASLLNTKRRRRNVSGRHNRNSFPLNPFKNWLNSIDWVRVRLWCVAVVIFASWIVLWGRTAFVQLIDGPRLAERARRQHISSEVIDLPRGMITDRNGVPLARSVECRSVYANPSLIQDIRRTAETLAPIVHIPQAQIQSRLEKGRRFAWIARRIDDATAAAVRKISLPGIELVREYERVYPYKQVAGQLLGFVGSEGNGLEGIERAFDDPLAASSARQLVQRDALGRRFQLSADTPEPEAENIRLTLDLQVQFIAESALARAVEGIRAKWGGVIVVDTRSGDVLAWAQYPSFNPNLKNGGPTIFRNRLALDALEPGSTFKPFTIASAMQEGIINRNTIFDCERGSWRTRYITIRDDKQSLGMLPVHIILNKSSNIGSAKIGNLLGAKRFHRYLDDLGFGKRVGLQLSESKGILRRPRDWSEADLFSTSFGQSISVTAAQMAHAYLVLANGGVTRPLNIVLNEEHRNKEEPKRIYSATVCREVLTMMREVVDTGTGKRAAIPGVSIAGKTGTAQKAGRYGKYSTERLASFVGFIPAEKPRYFCIVMLDEPTYNKYGGIVAAPVFKDVMTHVLAYYGELPAEALEKLPPQEKKDKLIAQEKENQAVPDVVVGELHQDTASPLSAKVHAGKKNIGGFPDVTELPVRQAVERVARLGAVPQFKGKGSIIVRQEPAPGTPLPPVSSQKNGLSGLKCTLWLSEK